MEWIVSDSYALYVMYSCVCITSACHISLPACFSYFLHKSLDSVFSFNSNVACHFDHGLQTMSNARHRIFLSIFFLIYIVCCHSLCLSSPSLSLSIPLSFYIPLSLSLSLSPSFSFPFSPSPPSSSLLLSFSHSFSLAFLCYLEQEFSPLRSAIQYFSKQRWKCTFRVHINYWNESRKMLTNDQRDR